MLLMVIFISQSFSKNSLGHSAVPSDVPFAITHLLLLKACVDIPHVPPKIEGRAGPWHTAFYQLKSMFRAVSWSLSKSRVPSILLLAGEPCLGVGGQKVVPHFLFWRLQVQAFAPYAENIPEHVPFLLSVMLEVSNLGCIQRT